MQSHFLLLAHSHWPAQTACSRRRECECELSPRVRAVRAPSRFRGHWFTLRVARCSDYTTLANCLSGDIAAAASAVEAAETAEEAAATTRVRRRRRMNTFIFCQKISFCVNESVRWRSLSERNDKVVQRAPSAERLRAVCDAAACPSSTICFASQAERHI